MTSNYLLNSMYQNVSYMAKLPKASLIGLAASTFAILAVACGDGRETPTPRTTNTSLSGLETTLNGENIPINKRDSFQIGGFQLTYRGASKVNSDDNYARFGLEDGDVLHVRMDSNSSGRINIEGNMYIFQPAPGSDNEQKDFPIVVDLDGNGKIG